MNILVVHEVDYLRKVVYEYQEIPEQLAARGHRVFVVDFDEGGRGLRWRTKIVKGVRRSGAAGNGGATVTLVRPPALYAPLLDRAFGLFSHPRALRDLLDRQKIDVIWLYSAPTNGRAVLRLARERRIPVVFRSIDVLHHLRAPVFKPWVLRAERRVYAGADRIAALTPALGRYTVALGAAESSVVPIWPAVDTELFKPGPRDAAFRRQWQIPDKALTAVYIGTLYSFSGLDAVLEQFPGIRRAVPEAHLLLVGGGAQAASLVRRRRELGLEAAVTLIPFRPFAEMPRFLREADLALNPFRPGPVTEPIIPTKILQYLACGLPVVSTPLAGTRELLAGEGQGVCYAPLEEFPRLLTELFTQPARRAALGRAGREACEKTFSHGAQSARIETLLREVSGAA